MRLLKRVTVGKVALAWSVLLLAAALILPNIGAHERSLPAIKIIIATYWLLLLVGTPITLSSYFRRAWRGAGDSPNRAAYVAWLSLETIAGVGVLAFLFYETVAVFLAMR